MLKSFKNFKKISLSNGFTLIELMVASSLFLVIMLMMSGSIFGVLGANQKSKNLRSVMDNLNLTLESMTRTIRFGTNYHCGSLPDLAVPNDCAGGSDSITVLSSDGVQTTYALLAVSATDRRITRTIAGSTYYMTSPEVIIDKLTFTVSGSESGDLFQPRVLMNITGHVESKTTDRADFMLQTTVSQRSFDF